ncbi:hypothetical protein [Staphylococcus lutrae]|uniref:NERD domain-containing protein n=1 Tax=Staphylococcus lutrae TaxID=155085 RepID=A0AAC9RV52_9STAP|nr:hypothetical protein [Staphylococcus lutrae]ARJ51774.1 hypothetical protein B5P37_10830 [Staphylococcus lutrae]PNZ35813.1 hypothetical protein CD134_08965 [Staphylococcus lutrae]
MLMVLWILVSGLIILTLLCFLRIKFYQSQLEVESYTKTQLLNKISILKQERHQSKEKHHLSTASTTYHLNLRNTKQILTQLLDEFKYTEKITDYHIITTSQIAPKNPLYALVTAFDFIVVTNIGLMLINIKSLKSKTFYHFAGQSQATNENELNQIVGHYLAHQYHQQFQSNLNTFYTFNEVVQENQITYVFQPYDPYQIAEKATHNIQEAIESLLEVPVSTMGIIYCVEQHAERIDGDAKPTGPVYTSENEHDLRSVIQHLIDTSHTQLSNTKRQQLVTALENHHEPNLPQSL